MSATESRDGLPIIDGKPLPAALDEKMVRDVVYGFYDAIRADDMLGPIFNGFIEAERWPVHLEKMCGFWSSMLLRTDGYDGRPLPPHLGIPQLDEPHFRRWLGLFQETVQKLCPEEAASAFMDRALRIAHSFRLAIAHNRGENTLNVAPILASSL